MMPSLSSSSPPLPPPAESSGLDAEPGPSATASATTLQPSSPLPPAAKAARSPKPWNAGRFALVTLATAAALAATVSLGRWQLSRAAQKIALQADIEAQKLQPPLDQDEFLALGDPAPVLHRPVRLRGLWLAPQTVYLDNRQMHGLTGFYVMTPFAIEGSERTVLVQRGWIPRNFTDRAQLAPVETPGGLVEITASISPPPGRLLDLGKAEAPSPAASGASMPQAWAAAAAGAASDAVATVVATIAAAGTADPAASSADLPSVPVSTTGAGAGAVPGRGTDASATDAGAIGALAGAGDVAAGPGTSPETVAGAGNGTRPASAAARNAAAAAAITAARDRAVGSSPIRQNLDLVAFRTETRLPLRTDLTLQQAGTASEGLLRDWPAPALGVEKHHGYAFQWFGLAGLVALLYVWFQLIAPWRRSRRQRHG